MIKDGKIWLAQGDEDIYLIPRMANRHGLIAGATGTGKTVTMKVLAESFSEMGVPVFLADIKGDVSGLSTPGTMSSSVTERVESMGIEGFQVQGYPTRFWDIFGNYGHPVRVTISDMGPVLLSRLLGLTEVQEGVLTIVFKVADDNGLLLIDLKDLRAMLKYVGDNRAEFTLSYGNVSPASIGAIQRALLTLEDEGGNDFFGEPALDIRDWMRCDLNGKGYINILNSVKLINSPKVYSTFLLWMLSELFEKLPEVGDLDKPRMIFFFDEAHMLFDGTSKALVQKISQVVKLIRSKGVGVYFVTQNPSDIPDEVLAQLSNRVQHALRAYTPTEQKAVKAAANAFRANPAFKTVDKIMALGVGEALVSCLDEGGIPSVVQCAKILPPKSLMGKADDEMVAKMILTDEFELKYRESVDRISAYEIITQAEEDLIRQREEELAQEEAEKEAARIAAEEEKARLAEEKAAEKARLAEEKAAEKVRLAEEKAAEKARLAEERAAEKAAEKERLAAEKAEEKARLAEEKAAAKAAAEEEKARAKKASAVSKTAQKAATSAASSLARSVSTSLVNSVAGGKTVDAKTMAKRAATNAVSSVMRSGSTALVRGLFGNLK